MQKKDRGKRRILSAGIGLVAFTAVEGLACGNPVEPPRNRSLDPPMPSSTPTPTVMDASPSDAAPATDASTKK